MTEPSYGSMDPWARIAALIATVATLLSGFNAVKVSQFESKLKTVEAERELNFRIYTSIADALESGDEKRVLAVRGIVNAMASESIKDAFLEALEPALVRAFEREQVELVTRDIVAKPKPVPTDPSIDPVPSSSGSSPWGEWDIDVFWCSSSGSDAETAALRIQAALQADGAQGRIRTRLLPESVNQKSGYGVSGLEIRRTADESAFAAKLGSFVEQVHGLSGYSFKQKATSMKTDWYVSVFVCP